MRWKLQLWLVAMAAATHTVTIGCVEQPETSTESVGTGTGGADSVGSTGGATTGGNAGAAGAGGCKASAECDDGNPCTDDICTAEGMCLHAANQNCGGSGASGGAGGMGGNGGTSGAGGTGGCVKYTCQPDDCGPVDLGCGIPSDCGSCAEQGDPNNPSPMMCKTFTHHCVCAPEGNSDIALARCNTIGVAEPSVLDFCYVHNGCDTAFCGVPPVPKAPADCVDSTAKIDYGDGTGDHEIWCCAKP